jgi:hypothetical protein
MFYMGGMTFGYLTPGPAGKKTVWRLPKSWLTGWKSQKRRSGDASVKPVLLWPQHVFF